MFFSFRIDGDEKGLTESWMYFRDFISYRRVVFDYGYSLSKVFLEWSREEDFIFLGRFFRRDNLAEKFYCL